MILKRLFLVKSRAGVLERQKLIRPRDVLAVNLQSFGPPLTSTAGVVCHPIGIKRFFEWDDHRPCVAGVSASCHYAREAFIVVHHL